MSSAVGSTGSSSTAAGSAGSALITSTGIGSGLNIGAIVSSLTTAYGAAQTSQLTAQQTSLNAQVSAYGTFNSALETLQATLTTLEDPSQLAGFDATVADKTIASASWVGLGHKGDKTGQAREVGKTVAAAAAKRGIESVVFDRGGYLYHGRVKALAEGAREGGLSF